MIKITKIVNGKTIKIIAKKDGKSMLTPDNIKAVANKILEKYNLTYDNMYIRGLNNLGYMTVKALNTDLDMEDDDGYLNGKVYDTDIFTQYFQAEFTIFTK